MNFRTKLFLSIVLAVLFTAIAEAGLDALATSVRRNIANQVKQELNQYTHEAARAFSFTQGIPELNPSLLEALDPEGRYRLLSGQSILTSSPDFPEDRTDWATASQSLAESYRLEVALPLNMLERLLDSNIFWDLIDFPLWLAMAVMIAFIITRMVARPVRLLTRAVEQLSKEQFPEPIPIPKSNDELTHLATAFNRMIVSLRDFMDRERAFTRYASHELRTPLSVIQAQVEMWELGLNSSDKVIPILGRNIRRMRQVLTTLLALARSTDVDTEPVELRPLLKEVLETFTPEDRARVVMSDGSQIKITSGRLVQQAVRNLVENALKYSQETVKLSAEMQGPTVRLLVSDAGPGVPEDVISKLTEPFFRLSEHTQGLGLGLALVQHIARSLEGNLVLRNTQAGLEASLNLPAYNEEAPTLKKSTGRKGKSRSAVRTDLGT